MKWLFVIIFFCGNISFGFSQIWHWSTDKKYTTIPFDFVNNAILISVKLNGEPLSFLLDNGVKETLLFGEIDSLRLKNTTSFLFNGFGIGAPIEGKMSRLNSLEIGEILDTNHHLYVIIDTTFSLSKNIGEHVHGILGSSFFRNNVVAIDYIKKKITFAHDIDDLNVNFLKYKSFPLEIENDRAYFLADVETSLQKYERQKMLVDLGNSDPLMLFKQELPNYILTSPYIRDYIGFGFNGAIHGVKNRIKKLMLKDWVIPYPIVSYPDTNAYDSNKIANERVGSIGNQILSRFSVIFDYPNNRLYLRKNRHFDDPFTLDMSGLEIVHEGFEFIKSKQYANSVKNRESGISTVNIISEVNYIIELYASFVIGEVRPNSPAERAGIKIGDKLVKINGRTVGKMKLQDIKQRLQAGQDKLIRMQISRGDKIFNVEFRLVDPLAI